MPDRRHVLFLLPCSIVALRGLPALAQGDPRLAAFTQSLNAITDEDVERAQALREFDFRAQQPTPDERLAQPGLPRRYSSDKTISARAISLIIRCEVSSQGAYETKYRNPIWPKGQSGVTIGIGYDIGYVTKALFEEDWKDIIPQTSITKLEDTCGMKGSAAENAVVFVKDVDVSWTAASNQFARMLKFVAGETVNALPGSEALSDDSFGALVSLVYNRGGGMKSGVGDPLDRRLEMRNIRTLLQAGKKIEVPAQIRSMKRIWAGDPDARGLLERREAEARLFELGL